MQFLQIIAIIQGTLLALLVWRVIYLSNVLENVLKFQEDVKKFQTAQCELNLAQRGVNNLFASELDRINFINTEENT